MKYIVRELQNINSHREGKLIEAEALSDAKRQASRGQFFKGTVLVLEYEGRVVSVKQNDVWSDTD